MRMINHHLSIIGKVENQFEKQYLKLRKKEERLYSDGIVLQLPDFPKRHQHSKEWMLRRHSYKRFMKYLNQTVSIKNLLEVGCGNGWFINQCAFAAKNAAGIDINLHELQQASRLFGSHKLHFYYWDLFTQSPFQNKFDLIVLNASVQYFEDFLKLTNRLKELLAPDGEIHILDSPFYPESEVEAAKNRSRAYYRKVGFPDMASFYHPHSTSDLRQAGFETLVQGKKNKLMQLLRPDSPFGWHRYTN